MRGINEKFEECEFQYLKSKKGEDSWHDAILIWAEYNKESNN